VRLSRWLAERGAARVGGVLRVTSEARLIAATGKDLSELVRQGSFSRELYEAIGVITIALPPLRQRKEDIRSWWRTSSAASTRSSTGP